MAKNSFDKREIFYKESQGKNDKNILERYDVMVGYYEKNPERIIDNEKTLSTLYGNDMVLMQDEPLRERLLKLLNLDFVKEHRREEQVRNFVMTHSL